MLCASHRLSKPCEKSRGRNDDAGLALDRLHQHGDGVGRDGPLDGGEVTKGNAVEAGREGSEAVPIVGLRGERDDGRGAAVKITVGDDDAGTVLRHALDAIAPAPRRLDRGLDRLSTGVHRQRRIEPREAAKFGEERPQPVVVEGTRGHGEAPGLRLERGENARMRMPMARRRIGAHHVDVAPASGIPEMSALAAR